MQKTWSYLKNHRKKLKMKINLMISLEKHKILKSAYMSQDHFESLIEIA